MRPTLDQYFMEIVHTAAKRSTCIRRQVGAIIVVNKRVASIGYNGAPAGLKHCNEIGGCLRDQKKIKSGTRQEMCRAVHAEQSAIIDAAKRGVSIDGGVIYINTFPCIICSKMIINAGIKRVVYFSEYSEDSGMKLFTDANVRVQKFAVSKN